MKALLTTRTLAACLFVGVLAGCTSAVPTDTPGVDQMGQYILRQTGPELDTVLGFRYAGQNPGMEWLILEMAFSSPNRATANIKRSEVFVRTPAGDRIPLATQKEFGSEYPSLRSDLHKASIARDPMDYFPPNRQSCQLGFFAAPGTQVVFDELSVNDRRVCQGRLYFKVPGGVQTGRWVFGIDLEESTVRIPFTM